MAVIREEQNKKQRESMAFDWKFGTQEAGDQNSLHGGAWFLEDI